MLETIVVPLDGSPLAERALPYATALARAAKARLILLRATYALLTEQPSEFVLEAVADKVRANGVEAEPLMYRVYHEEMARAICDAARDRQADLIAMSTHGRGGLGRWLYGSVADQVLREAEVPLLLISATCEHPWPEEGTFRILVPLDGSDLAEEALGPAGELATTLGAELLLLRAVGPLDYAYADGVPYLRSGSAAELAKAREDIEGIASKLRSAGSTVKVYADLGHAPAIIARIAREENVDLIAMATHGRSGPARAVMGSVATGVLQRAGTPMLLVRPAAMRRSAAESESVPEPSTATPEQEPLGRTVSVMLSMSELRAVRRGLGELLVPERAVDLSEPARRLLARLEEMERSIAEPGRGSPEPQRIENGPPNSG